MTLQQALLMSGGAGSSLASIVSGCLADLDATIADSYTTGQTWKNLVSAPADGSAQTAYDFYLGAAVGVETTDPVFTGAAGSPAAYFALDGTNNQFFSIAAGNTTAFNNLHKTTAGQNATFIMTCNIPNLDGNLMGTCPNTTDTGWTLRVPNTRQMTSRQLLAGVSKNSSLTAIPDITNVNSLVAVEIDYTAGILKHAVNARSFTMDMLTTQAETTSATYGFCIGSGGNGKNTFSGGMKLYSFAAFNKLLSDAELSLIVSALNTRHGRTYA